jgi:hypothetical protein
MAIAHINHVRQSTLTEYFLQNFKYSVTETIRMAYKVSALVQQGEGQKLKVKRVVFQAFTPFEMVCLFPPCCTSEAKDLV